MQQEVNPYVSPAVPVMDADQSYADVRVFSTAGRIGRVRYIGYSFVFYFLVFVAGAFAGFLSAASHSSSAALISSTLLGVFGILYIVMLFRLTIQRCHDFDASGWMSLLVLVPLVNLMFLFVPGTKGRNRFGAQTPPNGIGMILLACGLPAVAVIGILAAIALPAYQDYTVRARTTAAYAAGLSATQALTAHIDSTNMVPASLQEIGYVPQISAPLQSVTFDAAQGAVNVVVATSTAASGTLRFQGGRNSAGQLSWRCSSPDMRPQQLPPLCR